MSPLPLPDTHCFDDEKQADCWSYSERQMREYGQQCREAALEEAAQAIEQAGRARTDGTGYHFDAAAEIIEGLK